jgi:hypothetical protein
MTAGSRQRHHGNVRQPNLHQVVRALFRNLQSPARVIELYYWSREPNLCEIMRAIAAMLPETRQSLEAFLSIASKSDAIHASLDSTGRLTFSSQEVVETLDLMSGINLFARPSHSLSRP